MAFFEKYWDCRSCGRTGISALRQLKCPGCGSVKSPQDKEHFSNNEITDKYGLELAKGAPHWTCSHCGSVNLDKERNCIACGNEREESDQDNLIIELGTSPLPDYQPKDIWQEDSETLKPQDQMTENKLLEGSEEDLFKKDYYQTGNLDLGRIKQQKRKTTWRIATVLAGIIVVGLVWLLLFQTNLVEANVAGFSWSRTVKIEKYQTVHESGWSKPIGAYNVWSENRISRYEPIYETKTRTIYVPQTSYRDLGNGAVESYDSSYHKTETYRELVGQRPIYETWYQYDLDKWNYNREIQVQGDDRKPYWPDYWLNLDGQTIIGAERVGSREENYLVLFETITEKKEVKIYSYSTNQEEWKRYQSGINYQLKINYLGMIMNNPLKDKEKPK